MEEVIRRYKGIKDATVVAFDETSGGKYIAAYVVSDEKVDIHSLNDFIRETKPPYMVPAVTMQIDKIPLNQNQKVNKKELPKPEKPQKSLSRRMTFSRNYLTVFQKYLDIRNLELQLIFMMRDLHRSLRSG